MTTLRRESTTGLRPLLALVLSKYDVDLDDMGKQLNLEKELAWTSYDYFFPTEENPRPQYDIFLDPKARARAAMVQRIEDSLRLNTDDTPEWDRVIAHCIEKDEQGQAIEKYAVWSMSDEGKYNAPKTHQILQKPALIIGAWPQAFVIVKESYGHAL